MRGFWSASEPWPKPVRGEELLNALSDCFRRHLILPPYAPEACALWALHTYCYHHFTFTPRLHFRSPAKRCGKSEVLGLLKRLVREPLLSSDITGPVLFRVIEARRPTVLVDEFDSMSKATQDGGLRNVLNSGFECDGCTYRVQGDGYARYSTFAPAAVASIGSLPLTVADRSICVPMRRKLDDEKVANRRKFDGTELKRKCLRWVEDNLDALTKAEPQFPPELKNDRQKNCWAVLLVLADRSGGKWPALARAAAVALSAAVADDDDDVGELLLGDIRNIFGQEGTERIFSKTLVRRLLEIKNRPWGTTSNGFPLTPYKLSRTLSGFRIFSGTIRIGKATDKG
jgi:hypothetical protein